MLDMILISHSLLQCIGQTFFKPSYKSDRTLIGIVCDCHTCVCGKGTMSIIQACLGM